MGRLLHLLVALTAAVAPCTWGDQIARKTVGILSDGAPVACASGSPGYLVACMVDGLRTFGHVEGRDVAFEFRYANGDYKRLPALAAELVALRPDVMYTYSTAGANAAANATQTVPIVVGPVGDETMSRLAGSLSRPIGNVTGQTLGGFEQNQKCLQLLKELAPRTSRVAVIHNPDNPISARIVAVLEPSAAGLGMAVVKITARDLSDLPQALPAVALSGADAIFMFTEGPLAASAEVRRQVSQWALAHRLPLVSSNDNFAADGALMSLGTDLIAVARRSAYYVHRILAGTPPAELPVEIPTMFKLSLNLKTAAALGLVIPHSVLMRANEVIQ